MILKSLLFALLPSAAVPCTLIYRPVCCGGVTYANACVAGERQCDGGACSTPVRSGGYDEQLPDAASDVPPPLPRLRGTAQRNSSEVNGTGHESASPDDVIERAAVSNHSLNST